MTTKSVCEEIGKAIKENCSTTKKLDERINDQEFLLEETSLIVKEFSQNENATQVLLKRRKALQDNFDKIDLMEQLVSLMEQSVQELEKKCDRIIKQAQPVYFPNRFSTFFNKMKDIGKQTDQEDIKFELPNVQEILDQL